MQVVNKFTGSSARVYFREVNDRQPQEFNNCKGRRSDCWVL